MMNPTTIHSSNKDPAPPIGSRRFLPRIGSPGYHLLLTAVAILILGPLGGISAAFMNFSIGFFIGGHVLAGILGSVVTLPYGAEGKHGANYMQTMAASVASMCAMAVLLQAMVWLDLPEPPAWQLVLYFLCIGMFGVGIGMLCTPLLVDRMHLTYPSGFAVANILRALTDKSLLRRSVAKLGGGMVTGYLTGLFSLNISWLARLAVFGTRFATLGKAGISASTFGAGLIVGARIAIPALVVALIGIWQRPYLVSIGWLGRDDPYRKIGFILSLGTILGAAGVDITMILQEAVHRFRERSDAPSQPSEDRNRINLPGLVAWVLCWGSGTVYIGSQVLHQPALFLTVAVSLCFLFVLVNGIAQGISDWNPISSAFVTSVFILAGLGLRDPGVGLLCASILLIACSVGGDMQQDRSTGWRLGTKRMLQFRYQVIGIAMGAVLAVVLAKVFMSTFPILAQDQFSHPHLEGTEKWQSAMTFKLVGALKGITTSQPHVLKALQLGVLLGLLIEVARKFIKSRPPYKRFIGASRTGSATEFLLDAVFLPSPYASAFGGFVELPTVLWWTAGGLVGSLFDAPKARLAPRTANPAPGGLPADMSTMSLVGGGLIAGDSLAALSVGIYRLLNTVF